MEKTKKALLQTEKGKFLSIDDLEKLRADDGYSIIVSDDKGELYKLTAHKSELKPDVQQIMAEDQNDVYRKNSFL